MTSFLNKQIVAVALLALTSFVTTSSANAIYYPHDPVYEAPAQYVSPLEGCKLADNVDVLGAVRVGVPVPSEAFPFSTTYGSYPVKVDVPVPVETSPIHYLKKE